jgi:hypothetical protein
MAIENTNCRGRTSATPAISTNSLKGAGGGRIAGTISASTPRFRYNASARSV